MISEIGREMLRFQEDLAKEYGYKPIEPNLFLGDVREKYRAALPEWCKLEGDVIPCYTLSGTLIATGYKRIVIGDYGAFIECSQEQIAADNIRIQPGQEYRLLDERFRERCKYFWYTAKDSSEIKLYFQQKTVSYADYRPGMWYFSPYEVMCNFD